MTTRLLPAENLPVGEELDCGSHTVTAAEIISFAHQWDPQYFHTDEAASAESAYGGLIASGLHTLSIYQRLSVGHVLSRYDIVAGKEFSRVRFLRPVRPGDTLGCALTVESLEPPRHGRSLAAGHAALTNQDGKTVLDLRVEFLVRSART